MPTRSISGAPCLPALETWETTKPAQDPRGAPCLPNLETWETTKPTQDPRVPHVSEFGDMGDNQTQSTTIGPSSSRRTRRTTSESCPVEIYPSSLSIPMPSTYPCGNLAYLPRNKGNKKCAISGDRLGINSPNLPHYYLEQQKGLPSSAGLSFFSEKEEGI